MFDIFIHNVIQRKFLSIRKTILKIERNENKGKLPGLEHLKIDIEGKQVLVSPYNFIWKKKNKHIRRVLVIGSGPLQIG